MAISNRDRIGKALDEITKALQPYISDQLNKSIGSNWQDSLPPHSKNLNDISVLLSLFMEHWKYIFKKFLSDSDRAYISELKEARNKWAHAEPMSSDDVDRYLDTAIRLCKNINAVKESESIRLIREELRQQVFAERARHRTKYQATIGMKMCKIKICDQNFKKITLGRATLRYFSAPLSGIIFLIGFLMIGFTKKKQGLHDLITKTLHINK